MFAKFRKKSSPKMGDGGLDNLMRDVNAIGAATPTLPASFSTLGISGAGYFETDKGLAWLYERVSIVRKYINKTSGDCIKHWRTVRFTGDDERRERSSLMICLRAKKNDLALKSRPNLP
ncbi:MAG: hypothetical protein ACL7BU_04315 [Candidatus Phlomobacter fragariae]